MSKQKNNNIENGKATRFNSETGRAAGKKGNEKRRYLATLRDMAESVLDEEDKEGFSRRERIVRKCAEMAEKGDTECMALLARWAREI